MARALYHFHPDMNAHVLKTRRLILRPPVPSDADAIQRHVSDRRVAETTALIPHPYPEGGALDWIRRVEAARLAEDRHGGVRERRGVMHPPEEGFWG